MHAPKRRQESRAWTRIPERFLGTRPRCAGGSIAPGRRSQLAILSAVTADACLLRHAAVCIGPLLGQGTTRTEEYEKGHADPDSYLSWGAAIDFPRDAK